MTSNFGNATCFVTFETRTLTENGVNAGNSSEGGREKAG